VKENREKENKIRNDETQTARAAGLAQNNSDTANEQKPK
jgi:hypothetical protein